MEPISIVVPVFRGESTLRLLYDEIVAGVPVFAADFELILVEDGGGDSSWAVIRDLASRDSRVRGIRLRKNYGQHNALLCGIRQARHAVIVTMDDDLQHPVDQIRCCCRSLLKARTWSTARRVAHSTV